MSQPAASTLEFKTLEKGLLTFSPDTGVPDGFFVDAQNMLLTNKAPITIGGLTKFNTTVCPSGNIVWFEPHTTTAGVTTMLVATDTGRMYRYNLSGDTWTELRRDFTTGELEWVSVPFRGSLIISNSAPDYIMKYDKDATRLLPVGAVSVTDFEDAASWANGAADTTEIREGRTSVTYAHGGAGTITISRTPTAILDLNTGLNGAPLFGDTDTFMLQMFVSDVTKVPGTTAKQILGADIGGDVLRYNAAFYDRGTKFTASANYSISKIKLKMAKVGTITGTVHVEVQTDAAGVPSNTIIGNGTSASITHASLSNSTDYVTFAFSIPPALTNGTVYHIVLKGDWTPDSTNYVSMEVQSTGNGSLNSQGAPTTWTNYAYSVYTEIFDTTSPIVVRMETSATNYYETTIGQTIVNGWNQLTFSRGSLIATGTPSWANITKLYLTTTASGAVTIKFDDWYLRYLLAPPKARIVEMYAQQLCITGIPTDPVLLKYSDAGSVDYFSADQEARFSGGRHALEKTDAITALYSYFDELIVGKVNSAWTFSGTGLNVSISALPLTIGIDDHHAVAETPWSIQYLFENNIFGARLTSRGLVSTNITSLLANISNTQDLVNAAQAIRHDRTHTVRWTFRTNAANPSNQNDLGLLYDYVLDAWCCKYSPKIRWMTRGIVNGNRELLCAQYDGYIRRMDVGTDFDGTPIESFVTLPFVQHPDDQKDGNVGRWYNATVYLKGTATVSIDARFADEPHEFAAAAFTSYGTVQATPDGDKGFVYFGQTARWMQLRLRATSGSFEVCPPIIIGTSPTERRI